MVLPLRSGPTLGVLSALAMVMAVGVPWESRTLAAECAYDHPTWQDRVDKADPHVELPLNIEIVDEWDGIGPDSDGKWGLDCCTYIDLWYDTTHGERVPAYLVYPNNQGDGPFPITIMGPGGGDGRDVTGMQNIAEMWASSGIAAMVITFKHYRERWESAAALWDATTDGPTRTAWIYQNIVDIRRARMVIDALDETRNFDASRVGYIGWSFGGLMGQDATSIDPLFQAQVFCLSGSRLPDNLICGFKGCDEQAARQECHNEESLEWSEPYWFVEHLDGWRPVLYIAGNADERIAPEEVVEAHDLVTSGDKDLRWFDGGHTDMPASEFVHARAWQRSRLARIPDLRSRKLDPATQRLTWSPPPGDTFSFNVYRGSLAALAAGGYDHRSVDQGCALTEPQLDLADLGDGENHYYLVASSNQAGEGSLGSRSDGSRRPPASPTCP